MIKDSCKSLRIHKYSCLYKRCCNRHNKNIVNHQDGFLKCLINIYRTLQYQWLQHAAGVNQKSTVASERGLSSKEIKNESYNGCLFLAIMMTRVVKNKYNIS